MNVPKLLGVLLAVALAAWGIQALYLLHQNTTMLSRIRSQASRERSQIGLEYRQKLRDLEHEYERKKHFATGVTVFDRIFNTQEQSITDLIKRIAEEALPSGWSCDVKVEEFTHFILLVYIPHNAPPPALSEVIAPLQPIVKYCDWCLSDVAVFDGRHKSHLFFDSSMLQQIKSGQPFSQEMATRAADQGAVFTRFNSTTIECEKYGSHLFVPIEISGSNGIISCHALLDTGASTTMLSSEIISHTGRDNLQTAPRRTFSTVNGTISCPVVRRDVDIGGIRKTIEVAVNQDDARPLVGMNYFEGMNYIVDFGESAVYMWEK